MTSIGLGAVVVVIWPGLSLAQRVAGPCAVILTSAVAYGFVLGVLTVLGKISRTLVNIYGYLFFYGGVISLILAPYLIWAVFHDAADQSIFERAVMSSSLVPISLAAAGGAYAAIDSQR